MIRIRSVVPVVFVIPVVFALLGLVACVSAAPGTTGDGEVTTGEVVEPAATPNPGLGMVSCYLTEIPDAATLELWTESGRGSPFTAMASSAGSESPEPGTTQTLSNFRAAPAGDWPLGVYTSGAGAEARAIHIEAAAPAEFDHETWSGFVSSGDSREVVSCSYYPGESEASPSPTCDFEADPRKRYVGRSPESCAVMRFACEPGEEFFSDSCGCGCLSMPAGE